jgi:hypothetical protein
LVASSYERLAATYVTMAEQARSPEKTKRILDHVARLQDRAGRERADAERFRQIRGVSDGRQASAGEIEPKALP